MQSKVQAPAIAMLVTVGLTLILLVASFFAGDALLQFLERQPDADPDQIDQIRQALQPGPVNVITNVLGLIGCALIAVGAWQMRQLKSYGLALTASILVMIPCFTSCCCLLGLPIGIWSLIVLFDKDVKAAFAGQPPADANPPPL